MKSGLPCLPKYVDLPTYLPTLSPVLPTCELLLPVIGATACGGGWMGRGEREWTLNEYGRTAYNAQNEGKEIAVRVCHDLIPL